MANWLNWLSASVISSSGRPPKAGDWEKPSPSQVPPIPIRFYCQITGGACDGEFTINFPIMGLQAAVCGSFL